MAKVSYPLTVLGCGGQEGRLHRTPGKRFYVVCEVSNWKSATGTRADALYEFEQHTTLPPEVGGSVPAGWQSVGVDTPGGAGEEPTTPVAPAAQARFNKQVDRLYRTARRQAFALAGLSI